MVLWIVTSKSPQNPPKLTDLNDMYLEELQVARRLARNTITSYARDIRKLEAFSRVKQKPSSRLTAQDLQ